MKILQHGIYANNPRICIITCGCGCRFQFTNQDLAIKKEKRDGGGIRNYINCPECNQSFYLSVLFFVARTD